MHDTKRLFLLAMLFGTAAATGQQTWIVDANNGPGTNFTNLQPAINAAAPGDRILVLAGVYTPVLITKGLTIVGSPNAVVAGSGGYVPGFFVAAIPAGTVTSISGLTLATTGLAPMSVGVNAGAGTVIFDHVHVVQHSSFNGSTDVRCNHCTFDRPVSITNSTCTLDSSSIGVPTGYPATPALQIDLSAHVELNRCTVTGTSSAIHLAGGSSLVLRDDGGHVVATTATAPAIDGTGDVVLDPHVVLQTAGSVPITWSLSVLVRTMPSLAITAGAPGGTVDVDLFGVQGEAFFEFLGFASPPVLEPLTHDLVWLQPALLWAMGTFGTSSRDFTQIPLPNVAAIVGLTYSWQAVVAGPTTGLAISNCVSYVHPAQ